MAKKNKKVNNPDKYLKVAATQLKIFFAITLWYVGNGKQNNSHKIRIEC